MMFERLFRQKRTRIELHLTDAQIDQLREILDNTPLHARGRTNSYAMTIVTVLKQLPLSVVCTPSDAAADLQAHTLPRGPAGGSFTLVSFTPKGAAGMAHIERVLGTLEVVDERLPHGDSL